MADGICQDNRQRCMKGGKVYDALLKDKKREGGFINLVLINAIGSAVIHKVSIKDMEEIVNDLC